MVPGRILACLGQKHDRVPASHKATRPRKKHTGQQAQGNRADQRRYFHGGTSATSTALHREQGKKTGGAIIESPPGVRDIYAPLRGHRKLSQDQAEISVVPGMCFQQIHRAAAFPGTANHGAASGLLDGGASDVKSERTTRSSSGVQYSLRFVQPDSNSLCRSVIGHWHER